LVRSRRVLIAGAALLLASYLAMLVVIPIAWPLSGTRCTPVPVETCVSGGVNLAYPVTFLLSIAGTAAFFFGAFGKSFIVNPVFVAGMVALEYGLAGTVVALEGNIGVATNPAMFSPLVFAGAGAVTFQSYKRLRGRQALH
jgi:hypothetical protein